MPNPLNPSLNHLFLKKWRIFISLAFIQSFIFIADVTVLLTLAVEELVFTSGATVEFKQRGCVGLLNGVEGWDVGVAEVEWGGASCVWSPLFKFEQFTAVACFVKVV